MILLYVEVIGELLPPEFADKVGLPPWFVPTLLILTNDAWFTLEDWDVDPNGLNLPVEVSFISVLLSPA